MVQLLNTIYYYIIFLHYYHHYYYYVTETNAVLVHIYIILFSPGADTRAQLHYISITQLNIILQYYVHCTFTLGFGEHAYGYIKKYDHAPISVAINLLNIGIVPAV